MLKRFLCLFNKHEPRRSTTHWDGVSYVGECRHCGRDIRRLSRGNWKRDRGIAPTSQPDSASDPVAPGALMEPEPRSSS